MRALNTPIVLSILCFFFSSRRRHTRCSRDWSSDVCSSDLEWHWWHGPPWSRRNGEIASAIAAKNASRSPATDRLIFITIILCLCLAACENVATTQPIQEESRVGRQRNDAIAITNVRSEEHTSELQSRLHLVCRLLLEKKKTLKTSAVSARPRRQSHVRTVAVRRFFGEISCLSHRQTRTTVAERQRPRIIVIIPPTLH